MEFINGNDVVNILSNKAKDKGNNSILKLFFLGLLGGAFISLGYLGYIRILGGMPENLRKIGEILGAAVFPIGLISIYLLNAELVTGNALTMTLGYLNKKIKIKDIVFNWTIIAISNLIGAVIIAYLFGHVVGLTEGAYLKETLNIANAKVNNTAFSMMLSGIGANIFVCLAVWIGNSSKSFSGRIFGLWFPVFTFIVIGFQHSVANAFVIPAAIFSGSSQITVLQFFMNFLFVLLGNIIGGAFIVAIPAYITNRKNLPSAKKNLSC